jgi:hypothetical protein
MGRDDALASSVMVTVAALIDAELGSSMTVTVVGLTDNELDAGSVRVTVMAEIDPG